MQVFDEVVEFTPEMMQKAKELFDSQGTRKVVCHSMKVGIDYWANPDTVDRSVSHKIK